MADLIFDVINCLTPGRMSANHIPHDDLHYGATPLYEVKIDLKKKRLSLDFGCLAFIVHTHAHVFTGCTHDNNQACNTHSIVELLNGINTQIV